MLLLSLVVLASAPIGTARFIAPLPPTIYNYYFYPLFFLFILWFFILILIFLFCIAMIHPQHRSMIPTVNSCAVETSQNSVEEATSLRISFFFFVLFCFVFVFSHLRFSFFIFHFRFLLFLSSFIN
jgi:hypothetical protein